MITQTEPNIKQGLQNVIKLTQEKCRSFGSAFRADGCPRKLLDCWPFDERAARLGNQRSQKGLSAWDPWQSLPPKFGFGSAGQGEKKWMWGRAFDQALKEQRAVKTASLAPAGVSVHHNLLVSLSEFVSFQINSIDVHPEILIFYFSFYFFFLGCICFKEPSSGCGERLLSHQDASTCYLWKSGFELFKAGQATSMAPFGK